MLCSGGFEDFMSSFEFSKEGWDVPLLTVTCTTFLYYRADPAWAVFDPK